MELSLSPHLAHCAGPGFQTVSAICAKVLDLPPSEDELKGKREPGEERRGIGMGLAGSGPEGRGILRSSAAPTCQGLLSWLEGGSHLNIQRPGAGLGQGFQCCFLTRTSPGMLPARTTAGGELGDTEVSWRPMTTRVPFTSHLLWQCCLPVISHNPHTCPKQTDYFPSYFTDGETEVLFLSLLHKS